jgi:hypothetical protein
VKLTQAASADFAAEPVVAVRGYKIVTEAPQHATQSARWPGWARVLTLVGGAAGLWVAIFSVIGWALRAH